MVLPDSRDLINLLEHDEPLHVKEFIDAVSRCGHAIVLTLINVTEVLAPVLDDGDVDRMCRTFRLLKSIPHRALRESFLIIEEIDLALKAFRSGASAPRPLNAYVLDWRDTITPPWSVDVEQYLCSSEEEFLIESYRGNSDFFRPHAPHTAALRDLLGDNRLTKPGERRAVARKLFRGALEKHIRRQLFVAPTGEELERFGDWLYDNPMWCPSFWLSFALYQRWVDNKTDPMEEGDTHDFNLAMCLPYVDALTLDRRTMTYVRQAIRKTSLAHFDQRLYPDLSAWFKETCLK